MMSSSAASEMRDRCIKVRDTCTAACVVNVLGSASSEIRKHMHLLSECDHETKKNVARSACAEMHAISNHDRAVLQNEHAARFS
jgi:hypothetical protein